jgi:hypothetical protein
MVFNKLFEPNRGFAISGLLFANLAGNYFKLFIVK